MLPRSFVYLSPLLPSCLSLEMMYLFLLGDDRRELFSRKRTEHHQCNKCSISRQDKHSFLGKLLKASPALHLVSGMEHMF